MGPRDEVALDRHGLLSEAEEMSVLAPSQLLPRILVPPSDPLAFCAQVALGS